MRSNEFLLSLLNDTINKFIEKEEDADSSGQRCNELIINLTEREREVEELKNKIEFLTAKNNTLTVNMNDNAERMCAIIEELKQKNEELENRAKTDRANSSAMEHRLNEALSASSKWRIEAEQWKSHYLSNQKHLHALQAQLPPSTHDGVDISSIGSVQEKDLPAPETLHVGNHVYEDEDC